MQKGDEQKIRGLSAAEVRSRMDAGKVNDDFDVKTRSIPRIFRDNLCTLFNAVNVVLAVAILFTGAYRNLLFMLVIGANIAIGIFQEVRSKLMVDRLSVITSTRAHVVRDGQPSDIPVDQIVLDDIVLLGRGDQVPADAVVLEGKCSVNESLVTGESDIIPKRPGSDLMSGSFIVAGSCTARVTAVGADTYAAGLNAGAKAYKKVSSEIMQSLDDIVKYVSIALVPMGALLFAKEMVFSPHGDLTSAVLHTSGALIGMIPQGLILLTSAVLAVSVFRLSQHRVLVQQIYSVETLARVDVVCLDKTGTITTGDMDVEEVVPLEGASYDDVLHALRALVGVATAENHTAAALRQYVDQRIEPADAPEAVRGVTRVIPFSSERKYSGICFGSEAGNYALGAIEFVLRGHDRLDEVRSTAERLAGVRRVLVVAHVEDFDEKDAIKGRVQPLGLVFLRDRMRPAAREALEFFHRQGVRVDVISGDAVGTVGKIAQAAGLPGADRRVDMSQVESPEALQQAARDCRVFGRVSPQQKSDLVQALRDQGHTVAMVGDGVNDVLALHASDCPVAMGSGSDAARSIAQVVLLDDDFSALPHVVAEGRRSINNLQRSAVLYLTKTLFSIALAVMFVPVLAYDFPFSPVQVTVMSLFTIGVPSLVLALEPNGARVRGHFLRNVATRSAPGAVAVVVSVAAMAVLCAAMGLSQDQFQAMCVIAVSFLGMNVVARQSQPFNAMRWVLNVACSGALALLVLGFGSFLVLEPLAPEQMAAALGVTAAVMAAFNVAYTRVVRRQKDYLDALEAAQARNREL